MSRNAAIAKIAPSAAALALGALLALGAAGTVARPATAQVSQGSQVTYSLAHIEAALEKALTPHITQGRLQIEYDNRSIELHAPSDWGSLSVQNLYYSAVNGRFAAELVVPGPNRALRMPVSGRAYGIVRTPVLNRRVTPGDAITAGDVDWLEVRADQTGSDIAFTESQLIGMTPRRGIALQTPVKVRDLQSPRVVAKGALVTVTFQNSRISLTTQARALEEGGVGDAIRVLNTQSNRTVHVTVAGPNLVTVAKPGGALN